MATEEQFEEVEHRFARRFNAFVTYLDEGGGDKVYRMELRKRGRGSRMQGLGNRRRALEARLESYQTKLRLEESLDKRGRLENLISISRAELYEVMDEIEKELGEWSD